MCLPAYELFSEESLRYVGLHHHCYLDGAVKCLFLHFLREDDTFLLNFIFLWGKEKEHVVYAEFYRRVRNIVTCLVTCPGVGA